MLSRRAKLLVTTDPSEWHGMGGERLWVKKISKNSYRVDNSPLYAYGISLGDVVEAFPLERGLVSFSRVLEKGGHSNYRVLLRNGFSAEDFNKRWSGLEGLGCSYESSKDPEDVFAIDVPPEVDVMAVYELLEEGADDGIWHLDEGNFEHGLS